MTKTCEQCHQEFTTINRRARFCSRSCLYESMRTTVERTCQQCGITFTCKPWELTQGRGTYCSVQCAGKARIGQSDHSSVEPEDRQCIVCGSSFLVGGRGRPPKGQTRCSLACQQAGRYRKGAICSDLSPTDAAYIAGLIDGEGSIMLVKPGHVQAEANLRVTVANTYLPVLEWLTDITGIGRIYQHRVDTEKHRASYSWRCHGDGADSLLGQIRPYLRIKAVQADLALETISRLRVPALKADRTWQAEYRERMKAMNKRGPTAASAGG